MRRKSSARKRRFPRVRKDSEMVMKSELPVLWSNRASQRNPMAQTASMTQPSAARKSTVAKAFTGFQSRAVGKFGGRNLLASFQFDGQNAQNGCASAGDLQFLFRVEQGAGHSLRTFLRHRLAPDLTGLAAKGGVRARPGSKAAHAIEIFGSGKIPINAAVFFFQDRRGGGLGVILRAWMDGSRGEAAETLRQERRARRGEPKRQLRRCLRGTDLDFALRENIAGIHTGIDAHGGDTGFCFTVGNGPMDRRGAAILGKQGGMQIDPAVFRNRQELRRNDLAVGDDDNAIERELAQELLHLRRADFFRLMHGEFRGERRFLHRGKGNFLAAAPGAIRLRDHAKNLEIRLGEEMLQSGNGELRCAAEYDSHLYSAASAKRPTAAPTIRPVS